MLELYGTRGCPYTTEMREDLIFRDQKFVEYDVECDPQALERLILLTHGVANVPVLVEDGAVTSVGWEGRTCYVSRP